MPVPAADPGCPSSPWSSCARARSLGSRRLPRAYPARPAHSPARPPGARRPPLRGLRQLLPRRHRHKTIAELAAGLRLLA
eukprot:5868051-Pyramimonas_sp.AAC.1